MLPPAIRNKNGCGHLVLDARSLKTLLQTRQAREKIIITQKRETRESGVDEAPLSCAPYEVKVRVLMKRRNVSVPLRNGFLGVCRSL